MKKISVFLVLLAICVKFTNAQKTWTFNPMPNKIVNYNGDLAEGAEISDLSWASTSSNACWPATENTYFNGNHVFYVTSIPPHAELTVTIIPDVPSQNMSIYGFQVGFGETTLPPNISTCVACESERKWDRPKQGRTQDHTRSIYFNSIDESYRIVIGVVGANGLKTGTFKLKVALKADEVSNETQEKIVVKQFQLTGNVTQIKGKLEEGVKMLDLSWASTSSMACFPATQNLKFRGKHVLYQTEVPTNMDVKVTVIPDDKNTNMSIYVIQTGTGETAIPPDVRTCMACEAEHKWDRQKAGKTQDHTRFVELNTLQEPYRFIIGVAGADGVISGAYTLKLEMTPMR